MMVAYQWTLELNRDPTVLETIENFLLLSDLPAEGCQYAIDLGKDSTDPYRLVIYAHTSEKLFTLFQQLLGVYDGLRPLSDHPEPTSEKDWLKEWKASLKPFWLTDRVLIDPGEDEDASIHLLRITPAMAFGTGDHATTRLAARLLQKTIFSGCRVLDVGCGTGILSMMATALGSSFSLALDYDPTAVAAARECVMRNGMRNQVRVERSDLLNQVEKALPGGVFDVMVANIVADVLKRLLTDTASLDRVLPSKGPIILSGVIETQKEDFLAFLDHHRYRVLDEAAEAPWLAWTIERS